MEKNESKGALIVEVLAKEKIRLLKTTSRRKLFFGPKKTLRKKRGGTKDHRGGGDLGNQPGQVGL